MRQSVTSVYTELTKEAGKRGGPAALRAFYRMQGALIGRAQGIAMGRAQGLLIGRAQGAIVAASVSIAGTQLYNRVRGRGCDSTAVPTPMPAGENGAGAEVPTQGQEDDA
ncbi:hypothetical protein SM007_37845 [Streptomyces avermitilis]|nr:hypothetical protein SM007_37845 [Streptomyces avermitilis]